MLMEMTLRRWIGLADGRKHLDGGAGRSRRDAACRTFRGVRDRDLSTPSAGDAPATNFIRDLVDAHLTDQIDYRLVDYLAERRMSVDFSTLRNLAYLLGKLFWADIEAHHPGISSLKLPRDVALICSYTWECVASPVGPNEHANVLGYGLIADTFLKTYLNTILAG